MKYKEIESMSARQLMKLSDEEVKAAYATVRKTVARRRREFGLKNRRALGKYPIKKKELPPISEVSSIEKMREKIMRIVPRLRSSLTTWKGYKKYWEDQRQLFQKLFGDDHGIILTKKLFDEFGRFMGDMQDKYGETANYTSEKALDMWFFGQTLELDTSQIRENFEYWLDHIDEMEEAAEAVREQGKNHLTPSEALNKFKLNKH